MIVAKFGGSSLADSKQFRKVKDIILSDSDRHYVVPSAPGKRGSGDDKVTDLLYACYNAHAEGKEFIHLFERIRERYTEIIDELQVDIDLSKDFDIICRNIRNGDSKEYVASRGEYLNGKILAAYLGFEFVDAAAVIRFATDGTLLEDETNNAIASRLAKTSYAVIPGFYGADTDGRVRTFSRGGSDVSGALVARAVDADVYENWTDVSGMLFTDPRIVENPEVINYITYRELRELSY
ncbi:MAG: aspartate kinase, partial [Clostridiales bacterium]|nr:aspartate kinase [Clostridiales bacterium]